MDNDKKYYISVNDQSVGPLSLEEIVDRIKRSGLSPDDQILREGSENWIQIREIEELSEYLSPETEREDKTWFVRKNKENVGPMTKTELQKLLYSSEVTQEDYVWRKGLGNWMQIKDLYELKITKDDIEIIKTEEAAPEMPETPVDITQQGSLELIRPVQTPEDTAPGTEPERTEPAASSAREDKMQEQTSPVVTAERRTRKLLPEFIFGIAVMILGSYKIESNMILGSIVVLIGLTLVVAYLVSNRKRGTKDESHR